MKARHGVAAAIASFAISGCGTTGPIACTEIFVYGLSVTVVEEGTGTPLADGATLTLRDGDYVESTTESFDGRTMMGAGERAGTYVVTVSREGFHTWAATDVVVTADECHVIPVALTAELTPIP